MIMMAQVTAPNKTIINARRKRDQSTAQTRALRSEWVCEVASIPAASAQQKELNWTATDTPTSIQSTPPRTKGTTITGTAARPSVRARSPWAVALARTMSRPVNRVSNNKGKVPSLRSRLMQSAVISGTRIQTAQNRVRCSRAKSFPPSLSPKPPARTAATPTTSRAATPRARSPYVEAWRDCSRNSRTMTGSALLGFTPGHPHEHLLQAHLVLAQGDQLGPAAHQHVRDGAVV